MVSMTKLLFSLVFACIVAVSPATLAQNTGSLAGIVVDDRSHGVAGTQVEYHLLRAGRTDRYGSMVFNEPIVSGWVTTGSDGRFAIAGLRAGEYTLCALAKLPHQLHSCQWGQGGDPLKVTPGQQARDVRLVLRSGVRLTVHVADPSDSADPGDVLRGPAHAKRLLLCVTSDNGEYYRVHPVSKGQGLLTYGLAMPRGRPMRLVVDTDLEVSDAAGNPMVSKKPRPITEPEGPDGIEIRLFVRSAK